MDLRFEQLPDTKQAIVSLIKQRGPLSIAEMSGCLNISGEAVRQQVTQLEREKWLAKKAERKPGSGGGRPSMKYMLTAEGEHLFPKFYDDLAVELLDTIAEQAGHEALQAVLSDMVAKRVGKWAPLLQGMDTAQRVEALKMIYMEPDAHMEVEQTENGFKMTENNCPFYNVAMKRPLLCSVTVSVLTHLLGYRVVREEKFQAGDGRCVFAVHTDKPVDFAFGKTSLLMEAES